jgi:hypothetical protein
MEPPMSTPSLLSAALPGYRRVTSRRILTSAGGASFEEWTAGRQAYNVSTNAGAGDLPFQRWHRFKEAFSPELIVQAVRESPVPVRRLVDPFGGSGTSALSCQFIGIEPITIEVNPFLADLISAKIAIYHLPELMTALARVARKATASRSRGASLIRSVPATFVEPGVKERWLFDLPVAIQIARLREAIEDEPDPGVVRLFRVLLGGLIVSFSNAAVSGKGRRYRANWQNRRVDPTCVLPTFADAVAAAIVEIGAGASRPMREGQVLLGDSRKLLSSIGRFDQLVCSPPYPNSFDYTDVYNLELWMLGYLKTFHDNRELRQATLSSHVQISRDFAAAPRCARLDRTMRELRRVGDGLWDRRIPAMVGAYFADLQGLMRTCAQQLPSQGQAWFVVGDSQYAGIRVHVAKVLSDLAPAVGLKLERTTPFRSMRVSPQQSGRLGLSEDLVVFSRP